MSVLSSSLIHELNTTIASIAVASKGILAADESTGTITKRFEALQIPSTEESRRNYREILFTTPSIEQYICGVILFEETLNQRSTEGILFPELLSQKGIVPGIKVDKGLFQLAGSMEEKATQGLDGLAERLNTYKNQGARFAKWRAVFSISNATPSQLLLNTNAIDLARYATLCQEIGIVPIIEPEVLIDGDHSLERCFHVCEEVLHEVFHQMHRHNVLLEYVILKPSMITPGKISSEHASIEDIAKATLMVLRRTVPCAVPTINFLSGGQTPIQASQNLNAMHQIMTTLPWNLSFSFARALQEPCMQAWAGKAENRERAQQAFIHRAHLNSLATMGQYDVSLEKT